MDKRLLVTVSEDGSALKGVRFVRDFFSRREALSLTLFYTAPKPRMVWVDGEFFQAAEEYDLALCECAEVGQKALDGASGLLLEAGFPRDRVQTRMHMPECSTVRDLLREGDHGEYDAIVLGRRGAGQLQDLVADSVTDRLVDKGMNVPLWICRAPDPERSGVLLCLDWTESCMAMAVHVGRMLADEPRHSVTLLHVPSWGLYSQAACGQLYERARGVLVSCGVEAARIHERHSGAAEAERVILAEARDGGHAVVATGSAAGGGVLQRLFRGSVVRELLARLDGAVLWVGP